MGHLWNEDIISRLKKKNELCGIAYNSLDYNLTFYSKFTFPIHIKEKIALVFFMQSESLFPFLFFFFSFPFFFFVSFKMGIGKPFT